MIHIGLTGQARAGKDTVAQLLISRLGYTQASAAKPLKEGGQALLGLFGCTPDEATKDEVMPDLGITPRQVWKDLSEEFLKPKFGQDILAKILCKQIQSIPGPVVVSDVRFNAEAELLTNLGFKIIKVERPGLERRAQDYHVSEQGIDSRYIFGTLFNHNELDEARRTDHLWTTLQTLLVHLNVEARRA